MGLKSFKKEDNVQFSLKLNEGFTMTEEETKKEEETEEKSDPEEATEEKSDAGEETPEAPEGSAE